MDEYRDFIVTHPHLFSNDNAMIKIVTDEDEIRAWVVERKAKLRAEGKPEEWGNIGIVYNDPYIYIFRDLVEFPNGQRNSYMRIIGRGDLNGGQGVVVLGEMDGKYLLLRQFRHPTRSWQYEVPRGFGEANTPPAKQARTEILEEVEGEVTDLQDLGLVHSNTGGEAGAARLYFARLSKVGNPAASEGIEKLVWVSLAELEKMIADDEIRDGFTIAAYTRAKLRNLLK